MPLTSLDDVVARLRAAARDTREAAVGAVTGTVNYGVARVVKGKEIVVKTIDTAVQSSLSTAKAATGFTITTARGLTPAPILGLVDTGVDVISNTADAVVKYGSNSVQYGVDTASKGKKYVIDTISSVHDKFNLTVTQVTNYATTKITAVTVTITDYSKPYVTEAVKIAVPYAETAAALPAIRSLPGVGGLVEAFIAHARAQQQRATGAVPPTTQKSITESNEEKAPATSSKKCEVSTPKMVVMTRADSFNYSIKFEGAGVRQYPFGL